jgi:hypothetical protein
MFKKVLKVNPCFNTNGGSPLWIAVRIIPDSSVGIPHGCCSNGKGDVEVGSNGVYQFALYHGMGIEQFQVFAFTMKKGGNKLGSLVEETETHAAEGE